MAGGELSAPSDVTLALGGDVMFGRWIDGAWREHDEGPAATLRAGPLGRADVAIVNLETALCEPAAARRAGIGAQRAHRFAAPPERAAWLAAAGVDVAVVANNHALDCGPDSLARTGAHLRAAGIAAAGVRPGRDRAQAPVRVRVRPGVTVVVLAATAHPPPVAPGDHPRPDTVWGRDFAPLHAAVHAARARFPDDVLVVSLHWGVELAPRPSAAQRAVARRLVDAGADVIFGHGSHTLQEIERHGDGLIAYSLGNLHFDMTGAKTRDRVVLHVALARRGDRWRVLATREEPARAAPP